MSGRRGFTMVELMIGMVLLLIVGQVAYQLLTRTQRASQAQAQRIAMQGNLRGGLAVLPVELRELGYDYPLRSNPDVVGMAGDSIAIRAVRGNGIICNAAPNLIVVDTSRHYSAYRRPVATRDGLMIFLERNPDVSTDDRWVRRPLTGVGAGTCAPTFGGTPGLALTTSLSAAGVVDSLVLGSPVVMYEVMVYKLYQNQGEPWLGFYSASSAGPGGIRPLLGPLAENGFRLAYLDSLGTATGDAADVRSIRITLVSRSRRMYSSGGYGAAQQVTDSLTTVVSLRNTLR